MCKENERLIEIAEVLDHFIVSIFAILFASSYLQTENYYPKSKRNMFVLALLVLVFGVMFLFSNNHFWYVILELLVFLILNLLLDSWMSVIF